MRRFTPESISDPFEGNDHPSSGQLPLIADNFYMTDTCVAALSMQARLTNRPRSVGPILGDTPRHLPEEVKKLARATETTPKTRKPRQTKAQKTQELANAAGLVQGQTRTENLPVEVPTQTSRPVFHQKHHRATAEIFGFCIKMEDVEIKAGTRLITKTTATIRVASTDLHGQPVESYLRVETRDPELISKLHAYAPAAKGYQQELAVVVRLVFTSKVVGDRRDYYHNLIVESVRKAIEA